VTAFGDKLWQWDDYNQTDDGTLIWWDPTRRARTETGVDGNGLFRYVTTASVHVRKLPRWQAAVVRPEQHGDDLRFVA